MREELFSNLIENGNYFYICVPSADMRQEPIPSSPLVSEAFFSERVHLLEKSKNWWKIATCIDNYVGWVKKESVIHRNDEYPSGSTHILATICSCRAHLYSAEDVIFGPILTLPFESRLEVSEPMTVTNNRWIKVALPGKEIAYIQRGDVIINPSILKSRHELCALSLKFLGIPYTWGGRSSFGYDCSGFVQMLYRQLGVYLPRDSVDQCRWNGLAEVDIRHIQSGDLLFFGLAPNQIRHVGMYLGDGEFIHATVMEDAPYIHLSRLENPEWRGDGAGKYPYRTMRTLNL